MNDKFTNSNGSENIAGKLNQVVEHTHVNSQFVAELETKLRNARRPKTSRFAALFRQVSPTVRWVALMILLGLVLSLSIKTLIPPPEPAAPPTVIGATPTPAAGATTPVPQGESFDYGGAKLIMNARFPDAPAQVGVYAVSETQPATAEYVRALADRLGIEGGLYSTQGYSPDETALMVTDGKQELLVYTENQYTYTADVVKYSRSFNAMPGFPHENAETILREYMTTHGFDSNFRFRTDNLAGQYILEQLSPAGLPLSQSSMRFTLQENGEILRIDISLLSYETVPLGSYGIITAKEALNQLVDDSYPVGVMSGGSSMPDPDLTPQHWYHDYPDDQTVTLYGNVASHQAVDASLPPIIFIDRVSVTGNIDGMDALENGAPIQATGQFIVENGVRKFKVDTWDQNVKLICASGTARLAEQQTIITNEGESTTEYTLVDPPADLPLNFEFPDSRLMSCGAIVDGKFYWNNITYYPMGTGGGGGGGGGFFYLLNLSGTPAPFPTAAATQSAYSPEEIAGFLGYTVQPGDTLESIAAAYNVSVEDILLANNMQTTQFEVGWMLIIPTTRIEGERGTVKVEVYENSEGRQRTRYLFIGESIQAYYELKGENLEPLKSAANRPIRIWGNTRGNETGMPFLTMEKFEIIYPDLQFQILTGTQELKEVEGEQIVLFTTGGTTYVQMVSTGGYPDGNYYGEGEINIEALQVPEESYAGYPAIRVFSMGPAIDPVTGNRNELQPSADKIEIMPDPWGESEPYVIPDILIEEVELVYSFSEPYEEENTDPALLQRYLQPVWEFRGHNEHGDEVSILVQALRQEYLLPEIAP